MTFTQAPLRLFVDRSNRSGKWNMAFDEYLLARALDDNQLAVRVYGWETATVSLGYFQKDSSQIDPRLSQLPLVKRLSGGGAILHHHEITYSIAVPKTHAQASNPGQIYQTVHAAIIDELSLLGVKSRCRGVIEKPNDDPFLCFSRQDPNDIVLNETKIVGSAQRRRRGAILQHGSILLAASNHVPELLGISDLASSIEIENLDRESLGHSISSTLSQSIIVDQLSASEEQAISNN
jgi:lipoyl(octanoyl) transferase